MTLGVFLPAFLMTLIGHSQLERLVQAKATHALLDGVTAGVVGLIAATSFKLLGSAIPDVLSGILFVFALVLLYRWRAKAAVAVVVLGAGLIRRRWG
jgi:chromate transporter